MTEDKDKPSKELKEAMREIVSICEKREIGAHIILVSQTHAEYLLHFPKWSKAQFDDSTGTKKIRFKAKGKDDDETIAATVHFFQVLREVSTIVFKNTDALLNSIEEHMEITGGPKRVK